MTPSSAVGAAMATTSSASFCQSFKRFRNCMTPSILVVPTRSEFLPLAAVLAGIGLTSYTGGGSSSRFRSGRGCRLTPVGSAGPRTSGLAALDLYSRSDFPGAGSAAPAHSLARGRRACAGYGAEAAGGAGEVVPSHHLVQGGRLGGHVLRRRGRLLDQR